MSADEVAVYEMPNVIEMESARLKADIERAKQRQARMLDDRKKAPKGVSVGRVYHDPRDEQVARLVPDAMGVQSKNPSPVERKMLREGAVKKAKLQTLYDSPSKHRQHMAEGWVPVMDEDGSHAQQGGDLLYERPIEFWHDKRERVNTMNRSRLQSSGSDMDQAVQAGAVPEDVTEIEEVDTKVKRK